MGAAHSPLQSALYFSVPPAGEELDEMFESRPLPEDEAPPKKGENRLWGILRSHHGFTGFEKIREGEIWRVFTPMLLHFGALHLMFNMFWLYDLGGQIERAKGALFFIVLVLLASGLSNIAQALTSSPYSFGGMSGVVYALFGYLWMKQRFQPLEGMGLAPNTVFWMLFWLFLCMTGQVGPVANAAHVGGLLVGMAMGVAPYLWGRFRRG